MGLLDRGMAFLNAATKTAGAVAVVYVRGGTLYAVDAVLGERRDETTQPTPPGRTDWREIDFLVTVADLTAAGVGTPAIGDQLRLTLGGAARTFELMRREGEADWRYTDASRTCYRLHCKQVG